MSPPFGHWLGPRDAAGGDKPRPYEATRWVVVSGRGEPLPYEISAYSSSRRGGEREAGICSFAEEDPRPPKPLPSGMTVG